MSPKGIFEDLGDFITVGGHIEAGVMAALGYTDERVRGYVSSRVPSIGPQQLDSFMLQIQQGVEAGRIMSGLGPDDTLDPDLIPIFPDQYGSQSDGRRITAVSIYREAADDPGKTIRTEHADFFTLQELQDMLEPIEAELKRKYPQKFTTPDDSESFDFGANVEFLSRKF